MATSQISLVIRHLRTAALQGEGAGLTDGQLLESFVSRRETAALEVLVRRHGPMVWGVCRRILGNHHDAEDAFQATFLVLVRKAGSVTPREMVGNWLYGVAHQTARKARATRAKRRMREAQQTTMPEPAVVESDLWNDLQPVLDRELSLLPDKYRAVIVLCDLEGKTRQEAARQLGCPEGTVGSRLARARVMLAKRLAQHGLAVSGGALAAVLSQQASAGVPPTVLSSTIKAVTLVAAGTAATGAISVKVAFLAEGVLKAMLLTKLKSVVAGLLMLAVVMGGVGMIYRTQAAEMPDKKRGDQPVTTDGGVKQPDANAEGKGDEGVKRPEANADEFAWGKALDKPAAYAGLQVGIGVSPKDKRTYKAGESVKVSLKARNAGKAPITISYYEKVPLFGLVVEDEKGKRVKLLGGVRPEDSPEFVQMVGVGKAAWRQQSLKPGEEIDFGSQQLDFVSPKGNLNSWPRLLVSNPAIPAVPGKYKLSYVDVCLNMPKASYNLGTVPVQHHAALVSTGQVEVEIRGEAKGKQDKGVKQPEVRAAEAGDAPRKGVENGEGKKTKKEVKEGTLLADLEKVDLKERTVTVSRSGVLLRGLGDERRGIGVLSKGMRLENVPVAQTARIVMNGKQGKLADLKPGMRLSLKLAVKGSLTVQAITVEMRQDKKPEEPGEEKLPEGERDGGVKQPQAKADEFGWQDHPREWVFRYPPPHYKRPASDASPHYLEVFRYPHLLSRGPQSVEVSGDPLRVMVFKYL